MAHNPAGARALAASLPEVTGETPVIGVIGVLADKDAPGMLADIVVMDRDLEANPVEEIDQAHAAITMSDGRIVWEA